MRKVILFAVSISFFACTNQPSTSAQTPTDSQPSIHRKEINDKNSWTYFLQHLPEKQAPVLDYKGNPIAYQEKHAAVIDYDIGNKDLQQCADALMRLRAEYLFAQKRYSEIHFHFVSGQDYAFLDYCRGKRPAVSGSNVRFVYTDSVSINHQNLRRYLDIVYAYASTISLAKELSDASAFAIGSIVITPGSPGHCFIITDEAKTSSGDAVYKLVEGYTPAKSIYVLQNLSEPELGHWHRLAKGDIETASYSFHNYKLKKFEETLHLNQTASLSASVY